MAGKKKQTSSENLFQDFFTKEAAGGILLIICTIIALIWANSPWAESYVNLWKTYVIVGFGEASINKPLLLWINDGLMAIFFFVVGLEIKRELLDGELSSRQKATLPLAAAVGGAIIPALIYVVLNIGTDQVQGWGVPMATDIAFALGVLALLGSRAPLGLKIFVTALAIVDDLMAVLVIALFYTETIYLSSLAIGGALLVVTFILNRSGVHRTSVYVVLGLAVWVAFLKSGVHATVAGVLFAFMIPSRARMEEPAFMKEGGELLDLLQVDPGEVDPTESERQHAIHDMEMIAKASQSPSLRMEHILHSWVAFAIMPIFALSNAGVSFSLEALDGILGNGIFLGIFLGLLVGKPVGIMALTWIAIKTRLAVIPEGVTWRHLIGASALAGIGFTMALFIANLAFSDAQMLETAKVGILAASLTSGIIGWVVLSTAKKAENPDVF